MPVVPASAENIERAAARLRAGGVVAFPTETVYGLGANAFDAHAVARVFEIKRRPTFDPLIVHVAGDAMLERVAARISPLARALIARFWPGPLTLVLPKAAGVAEIVTSGLSTVAVRMPDHPVARRLIEACGCAVAAPSANPFGYVSPTRAEHVERMLGDAVDLILDAGPSARGIESTIVALEPRPAILRFGAISREEIEVVSGPLEVMTAAAQSPLAPGQLAQHYAPLTPLRVVDFSSVSPADRRAAGALAFGESPAGYARVENLSEACDPREAAARLFAALYELDAAGLERIDAARFPDEGLGRAIADRLRRASRAGGRSTRL